MIHAGKGPAGIAFLELSDRDMPDFLTAGVAAAIKTGHFIIDMALVVYSQDNFIAEGFGHKNAQQFLGRVYQKRAILKFFILAYFTAPDGQFENI